MEVIDGWPAPPGEKEMVVALGNFDGVHLGHQALIKATLAKALNFKATSVVLTFHPHPSRVLEQETFPGLLSTKEEKCELLSRMGVDRLVFCPFTPELSLMKAEQFVRQELWERLRPLAVGVGFNYSFGHGGKGNPQLLASLGQEIGFEVFILPPVKAEGRLVSSSVIREALQAGNIELARSFLGRWPVVHGRVGRGYRRGNKMGFPTANLEVPEGLILPAQGVYAALASWGEEKRQAVVNLGRRPTFGEGQRATIEAHLLDFRGDLYGRLMQLEFRLRLREERRFASPEELAGQIGRDVSMAREYFTRYW